MSKVAVVTGANKGIGFEVDTILFTFSFISYTHELISLSICLTINILKISRKLACSGYQVILGCRNEELGKECEAKIRSLGGNCEYRNLDISNRESIFEFAQKMNTCDVLINNAAIAFKNNDPTPFTEQGILLVFPNSYPPLSIFNVKSYLSIARPTIAINYHGTLEMIRAMVPILRKAEAPIVVNIGKMLFLVR